MLAGHGLKTLVHNLSVEGGELDLICTDGSQIVAVEVRTRRGGGDPIDAIGHHKRRHVARLAALAGIGRVDLVGIGLTPNAVEFHWLPDAV